ncbi:MAG: hypothetical protein HC799_11800 [Limnothrix sp. RL_2_0]|nr:hypothetical protein [Limnothrix sp. RL_2_0]
MRQRGSFAIKTFTLDYSPETLCYQPQPLSENTRVVIQSHGLGATPRDFADYAEHLASHGYFVVAPYHQGSDTNHLKLVLQGDIDEVVPFSEFGDRPATITAVLNKLDELNGSQFDSKLDLKNVGVMGHSFGAYTALVLAGAEIQFEHLELACDGNNDDPNLSLLLQCQALGLPRAMENLRDSRVASIFVWDFVGSAIFGEKGLAAVNIPVMAIAGSHDITTPFALEQIRLFRWLRTAIAYLVMMEGKPHVQNLGKLAAAIGLNIAVNPQPPTSPIQTVFAENIQAFSLAFFAVHLQHQPEYLPYLTANYGQYLGRSPQNIYLLNRQNSEELHKTMVPNSSVSEREALA